MDHRRLEVRALRRLRLNQVADVGEVLDDRVGYPSADRPGDNRVSKAQPQKQRRVGARVDAGDHVQALVWQEWQARRVAPGLVRGKGAVTVKQRREIAHEIQLPCVSNLRMNMSHGRRGQQTGQEPDRTDVARIRPHESERFVGAGTRARAGSARRSRCGSALDAGGCLGVLTAVL